MSFFDKLRGSSASDLSPRAAMVLACMTMIAADGHVDDDEMAILHRINDGDNTGSFDQALRVWKQIGRSFDCIPVVAPKLDEAQRRFTLANLVDIAMADGILGGAEEQLLGGYLEAFGLDDMFVNGVAEVISIKNDRSPFGR
jgi:uncharacterized tellurite resistance protein B-like protein